MAQIDGLIESTLPEELDARMMALKPQIDQANESTVCKKEELDIPTRGIPVRPLSIAKVVLADGWKAIRRRIDGRPGRRRAKQTEHEA